MNDTQPPVAIGDILADKYRVEAILGRGGMGVVVAAQHLQLGQRVAIKFLLVEPAKDGDAVQRFLREARAAVRIQSEHVARVIDVGTLASGAPYMVMEFLVGCDLAELIRREGAQPIAKVVDLVLQAGEAIAEAHSKGIIHRDLKPANLFLTQRPDGTPMVKVLDFGISKSSTADELGALQASMTATATVMGSPLYMSPEQMRSTKNVDARTDIWSIGVILFELLTGRPVYEAESLPGLCAMIASDPPPPLRTLRPDAPPELERVIDGCLSKKPSNRPQSVAELAYALAPFGTDAARLSAQRIQGVLSAALPTSKVVSEHAHTLAIGQAASGQEAPGGLEAASGHGVTLGDPGRTVDGWGTTAQERTKSIRTAWMLTGGVFLLGLCIAIVGVVVWAPWRVSDIDVVGSVPVADDSFATAQPPDTSTPAPPPIVSTGTPASSASAMPSAPASANAPPRPLVTTVPRPPRTQDTPPAKPPKPAPTATATSTSNESDVLNERR